MISFNDALELTHKHIHMLKSENVALLSSVDHITACDLPGLVNSPSADVSLKDGYAIHSGDIVAACKNSPVSLHVKGMAAAGSYWQGQVNSGEEMRILSGAPILDGADSVIAEEFTCLERDTLLVMNDAHAGRNILFQGSDVHSGELQVGNGVQLSAPRLGSLVAAGFSSIPVVKMPRIAILATGDEVIAPGEPLIFGKLYASNLITLAA
jgi:molybdopterin molybdotransferase